MDKRHQQTNMERQMNTLRIETNYPNSISFGDKTEDKIRQHQFIAVFSEVSGEFITTLLSAEILNFSKKKFKEIVDNEGNDKWTYSGFKVYKF